MKYCKYLTVQNIAVVSVTVAVLGFLGVKYYPQFGIIGNIMGGRIILTEDCFLSLSADGCWYIAYRWLLALDILLTAVALIVRQRFSP